MIYTHQTWAEALDICYKIKPVNGYLNFTEKN